MTNKEFIEEVNKLGIEVTEEIMLSLKEYYSILKEENSKYNLTRIIDEEDVYLKHFYDSLTINKIIDLKEKNICDMGSGAGFPGLVIAIFNRETSITLIESNNKKCTFLNIVKERLHLDNVKVINTRMEDYAKENREVFDIVTARAVAPLKHLLEYGIPMTKVGGYLVAMKANVTEEETRISNYLSKLKIKEDSRIAFKLPKEESQRTLIKYQKQEPTDKKYPRKYNEILKKEI